MNKSELKKIIKEEIQILQEQTTSNSINNSLLLTAFATWVNSNGGWSDSFSNCMSISVRGWLLNDIFTLPVWNSQNSNQPCQFINGKIAQLQNNIASFTGNPQGQQMVSWNCKLQVFQTLLLWVQSPTGPPQYTC